MIYRSACILGPEELLTLVDTIPFATPTPDNLLILGAIMELHDSTEYTLPIHQLNQVQSSLSIGLLSLFNNDHKVAIQIAAFSPSLKDELELIQQAAEHVKPDLMLH
jgi:hypothetical protein